MKKATVLHQDERVIFLGFTDGLTETIHLDNIRILYQDKDQLQIKRPGDRIERIELGNNLIETFPNSWVYAFTTKGELHVGDSIKTLPKEMVVYLNLHFVDYKENVFAFGFSVGNEKWVKSRITRGLR